MYTKKYFPQSHKLIAEDMVANIKAEFKIMLEELDWMDSDTKVKAQTKVDKIKPFIGYSEEILDNNILNELFQNSVLSSSSFLENYLKLNVYIAEYTVKEFRKPILKSSWKNGGPVAAVDAYYSRSTNTIHFPAGIIDDIFFQEDRPNYMNYGAFGFVVGHEITHGFDDEGSQWDGDGNLVNWWELETKKRFLTRAQCIVDQYSNFTVKVEEEVFNISGSKTQGENIADNGGYKEAFKAYQRLVAQEGEEMSLPGLPYTPYQLFWLSGASVWCSKTRPKQLKNSLISNAHVPSSFRVTGPFRNIPEFSETWKCPRGSPMNPETKCTVW